MAYRCPEASQETPSLLLLMKMNKRSTIRTRATVLGVTDSGHALRAIALGAADDCESCEYFYLDNAKPGGHCFSKNNHANRYFEH